jgi:glycosyltransferase involved in cell wall biosynthesis
MDNDHVPDSNQLPSVAVVVPSKNRWDLLQSTLQSILLQRDVDIEVILVDDGSSDPYEPRVALLAEPRIRVIRTEGLGLPAARNVGLTASEAEWTAFCDDDDLWAPDKLAEQMGALRAAPDADWCYCSVVHFNEAGEFVNVQRALDSSGRTDRLLAGNTVPGGGSAVVVRTQVLRAVGGFDPEMRYAEDWDAWLRLSSKSLSVPLDRPLVAYRVHAGSMSFVFPALAAFRSIDAKYAAERRAANVDFDWGSHYYNAGIFASGRGDRRGAFADFSKSARHRRAPREGLLALAAFLWPARVYARAKRYAAQQLPEGWSSEVNSWLVPLLTASHPDTT